MEKCMRWHKALWIAVLAGVLVVACAAPAAPPAPTPIPAGQTPQPTAPSPKPAQKLEKVKLQLSSKAGTFLNFYLGKEKGIYQQEGIDLELLVVKASLAMAALMAGELDYTSAGTSTLESGLIGLPVKMIMGTRSKVLWRLIAGAGINTPADLKGKTVSVTSIGATAHYVTRESLRKLGLDPDKDVIFVGIGDDNNALIALKSGAVAAATLISPADYLAKEQGYKELVFTGEILDLPQNGMGTTERRLKENPDQAKKMIRATIKSLAYMKDHQDEGRELLVREFGVDRRLAPAIYKDLVDTLSLNGGLSDKEIKATVDMARSLGRIKGEVPIEKGVDLTLLKEVQKEMKLVP
ncbi:MAG: ABC transporter substrate-binding protein [Chloroflexi bacterium]|nr:ABC transporter substrate-binding protein [Chloroflexota bacterium]